MPTSSRSEHDTTSDQPSAVQTEVTALETRPGRVVFLEDGNTDGWIAADNAVDSWL
jgi:hypothetical protein